jgi:hypothetical protein
MNKTLLTLLAISNINCIFDPSGITETVITNPTTTIVSSTIVGNDTENNCTNVTDINPTSTISTSNLTDIELTSTEGVDSTTVSNETTTSLDVTTTIDTTLDSTTMIPVGNCGDCVLQPNEECDWCIFEYTPGYNYCTNKTDHPFYPECIIGMTLQSMYAEIPLSGMNTPEFDQEEADLLCKLQYRDNSFFAKMYYFTNEITFPVAAIMSMNFNSQGHLLKTAEEFYQGDLYYFINENIPKEYIMAKYMYSSCAS